MTKFDKRNRRCRKLVNKKYRRYGDIWGRLALKKRDNFITNLVYNYERQTLNHKKKRLHPKSKRRIQKIFRAKNNNNYRPQFAFDIIDRVKLPRRRRLSRRGNLLKLRRQISLFYGGGRIRRKTFRRYGRMATKSHTTHTNDPYGAVVESRLDVLLLRSNFVDSIYRARAYIFHRKCYVQGHRHPPHPGVILENFQKFGLRGQYLRRLRKSLYIRIKKHAVISLPSYLYISFSLLVAFKIEDPVSMKLSFPFSEQAGAVANFRKAFSLL